MQAVEPFVQQTVKYLPVQIPIQTTATMPISNRLQFRTGQVGLDTPPDFATKAGFYNGLFSTVPRGKYSVTPTCTGVSCTWPDYYTLGFRSSCVNITDQVQAKNITDRQGQPQTRYSAGGTTLVNPGTDDGNGEYVYKASFSGGDIGAPSEGNYFSSSFNITFLAVIGWTTIDGTATHDGHPVVEESPHRLAIADTCTLQLCVKKFTSANFTNGQLIENEIPAPEIGDNFLTTVQPPGTNLSFSVDVASWTGLSNWLNSSLTGAYLDNVASGENFDAAADARDAVYQAMIGQRENMLLESLFDNVANSLTQGMRMANGPDNGAVDGTTYVTETVVRVQWAWLSLPFIVEALILLYLLGMMMSSRGMSTWKDQTLATLCHGLDQKTMADVAALQSTTQIDREAKRLKVQLVTDHTGSRLSRMSIPLADR